MTTSIDIWIGVSCTARMATCILITMLGSQGESGPDSPDKNLESDFSYAGKRLSNWIELLDNPDPAQRLSAVRALKEIGPDAKPAVPALTEALAAKDEFIRSEAASALAQIGPDASSALPAMTRALQESSYFHQGIIAPAIARIGPAAIPFLTTVLRENPELCWEVLNAIGTMGFEAKEAVPYIRGALSDQRPKVREAAAFALWEIARERDAIIAITECLSTNDDVAQMNAADHLGQIGSEAADSVPALIRALSDQNDAVRNRSAAALGRIGPSAKDAIHDLMKAVGTSRPGFRLIAAKAAAAIGPSGVPPLIKALQDPEREVRGAAADALGKIGPAASDAAAALESLMSRPDSSERLTAAVALWLIRKDEKAVTVLIGILQTGDAANKFRTMIILEQIGSSAKEAVPALIEILTRETGYMRVRAAEVLGRVGPSANSSVPALDAALSERDGRLRVASALALWRISRADRGLAALIKELKGTDESITRAAEKAIGEIGPDAELAVPALVEALKFDSHNRSTVARSLGAIGPRAKAAVPALVNAFEEDSFLVRESITKALQSIDPESASAAGITLRHAETRAEQLPRNQ